MKLRPILGSLKAAVRPHAPYFAHFFVTERCNLRCSYCDVWRNPRQELDREGHLRIVQRISDLGVSCLSFTGGEPLLREDLPDLMNFSVDLGMHTRVTSNGMAPRRAYERLLDSRCNAFSISIDGVGRSEAPFRKVNEKNRETILFLAENRGKKHMGLSCVLHAANAEKIRALCEWLAIRAPGIRLHVQPVVTGVGRFRRQDEERLSTVEVLFELSRDFPGVVDNLAFFNRAAAEAARRERFDWGCRAGTFFFDIKPNGDFWICQDNPTALNILDPDFESKWRAFDCKPLIASCAGCTYSCYIAMQKAFEPKNMLSGIGKVIPQLLPFLDRRHRPKAHTPGIRLPDLGHAVTRSLGL